MESETKLNIDQNAHPRPIGLSNNNMKFEILDDDFCIDNFQHLDDHFPLPAPSSYINGIELNGYDPFDPFGYGLSSDFDLCEFKPNYYDGNGLDNVQSFQRGGLLNFPNNNDVLMDPIATCHDSKPLNFVVPDEGSCVTANNKFFGCHKNDNMKRNKNIIHNNSRSSSSNSRSSSTNNNSELATTNKTLAREQKKSKSAKGQWTIEEDRLLIHLVEKHGLRKWSQIAQMLKGRIGKQCRERWHNHLRPDIKKDLWTEEEDRILIEAHAEVGNKWAEIAKKLLGRTENSIKNHWNATKRRQFSRRKCRTKWPKPSSLLQNYIKSLNLEKGSNSNSRSRDTTAPPPNAGAGIINNTSNNVPEVDFTPADRIVPDFTFDEFTFDDDDDDDDDDIFIGSSMDTFMNDIQKNEAGFDVELPFDMPPLMQCEVKEELDGFMG
ncbi:Transcription factor, Myb superfamily [Handroanthus impetiginosus]|uniref:Transcription factor, Myb superfamily n=1 Tax=Handroanthus impetiginosus TaxID=429701 RepID=A0A2G9HVJ7_9LAMI|nr:Transcription factor, Myb superfamily [Handroanthus impetiginosus]